MASRSHTSRLPLKSTSSSSGLKARRWCAGSTSEKPLRKASICARTPSRSARSSTACTYSSKSSMPTSRLAPRSHSSTLGSPGSVKSRPSSATGQPCSVSAATCCFFSAALPPPRRIAARRSASWLSWPSEAATCGLSSCRSLRPRRAPSMARMSGAEKGRSTSRLSSSALATKRPMKVKSCSVRAGTPPPCASCLTTAGKRPAGACTYCCGLPSWPSCAGGPPLSWRQRPSSVRCSSRETSV
mmetsp:Transcript_37032/g.93911  ORF Transcript_37032/g.93911 Transcript_37032/m.93911 type:complete len:243 (-) Transcript_37032:963-1691(-)